MLPGGEIDSHYSFSGSQGCLQLAALQANAYVVQAKKSLA